MILCENDVRKSLYIDAYKRLVSFLKTTEPQLVYFLARATKRMGQVITYAELREALLKGGVDKEMLARWMQAYVTLFSTEIVPHWQGAILAAAEGLKEKYPNFLFDANSEAIKRWAEARSASLITSVTAQQMEAVNVLIVQAVQAQDILVDELACIIRPMVGLHLPQARANMRYFQSVRASLMNGGMDPSKATRQATKLSIQYAEKQHRYRAMTIARTELCEAYRCGEHQAIRQAQVAGYIGRVQKQLCSAGDERVCKKCKSLEGKSFEMDEEMPVNSPWDRQSCGVHPSCCCVYVYTEVWESDK